MAVIGYLRVGGSQLTPSTGWDPGLTRKFQHTAVTSETATKAAFFGAGPDNSSNFVIGLYEVTVLEGGAVGEHTLINSYSIPCTTTQQWHELVISEALVDGKFYAVAGAWGSIPGGKIFQDSTPNAGYSLQGGSTTTLDATYPATSSSGSYTSMYIETDIDNLVGWSGTPYDANPTYDVGDLLSIKPMITNWGSSDVVYSLQSGALPVGSSLDPASGFITNPSLGTAETVNFTIAATNGAGASVSSNVGITISSALDIAPVYDSPAYDNPATNTQNASLTWSPSWLTVGIPAPTFAIQAGALPVGTTLQGSGTVTGTPTNVESGSVTIRATNTEDFSDGVITWDIVAPSLVAPVFGTPGYDNNASYVVGNAISLSPLFDTIGQPAPAYSIIGGTLPAALSLNVNGTVVGTLDTAESVSFTVEALNGTGSSNTVVSFTVAATGAQITDTLFSDAAKTTPYTTPGVKYSITNLAMDTLLSSGSVNPDGLGNITIDDGLAAGTVVVSYNSADNVSLGIENYTVV